MVPLDTIRFHRQSSQKSRNTFMRRSLSCALVLLLAASTTHAVESTDNASTSKSSSRNTDSSGSSGKKSSTSGTSNQTQTGVEPQKSTDSAKRRSSSKEAQPKEKAATSVDKSPTEDERFNAARRTASEDPHVVELRTKADAAKNDEMANKALRAYFRALYDKMREIAPGLEERITMTETAALRALPATK
jgi:hypothetical protein